jgi:hypothetical protein
VRFVLLNNRDRLVYRFEASNEASARNIALEWVSQNNAAVKMCVELRALIPTTTVPPPEVEDRSL